MLKVFRYTQNPILNPEKNNPWEECATFNGSPVRDENGIYHMLYRAQGQKTQYANANLSISTIGYVRGEDAFHFSGRKQFIKPEYPWEKFGCEDPRVTKLGDKYYIFYTALSSYPFGAHSIRVALATTKDFITIDEKHPVTTFNAKAMALFPEKINGKFTAVLTANTDMPPSKIAIATFEKEDEIWSVDYWEKWYKSLDSHTIPLQRSNNDHIEVGAPPVKTKEGWLLIYCYIYNYNSQSNRTFAIEAVLLDENDPQKIIARTPSPLMVPKRDYEFYGDVPNVVFPSGAVTEGEQLYIYYGAADTTVCVATSDLNFIIAEMLAYGKEEVGLKHAHHVTMDRNMTPIISPIKEHKWESKYTFNPAAIYLNGRVHMLYRAMGDDDTSVMGYASSPDGINFDERLPYPVYVPREGFEQKSHPGFSGCEDPRITQIEDKLYVCYTAYNGSDNPRVALTYIKTDDFLAKKWNWTKPVLISPPGIDDKDACLFPEKINGKYAIIHRFNPSMWIDFVDDLHFGNNRFVRGEIMLEPRVHSWDSEKIGIGPSPIKTSEGWVVIYHGLSRYSLKYRMGAMLLDLHDPKRVLALLPYPLLEPIAGHEKQGYRPDTVFVNGAVEMNGKIYCYYGGGDQVVGVAYISKKSLLEELRHHPV